jgi:hypothetical protein
METRFQLPIYRIFLVFNPLRCTPSPTSPTKMGSGLREITFHVSMLKKTFSLSHSCSGNVFYHGIDNLCLPAVYDHGMLIYRFRNFVIFVTDDEARNTRGGFVEQKLVLSCNFRRDQIHNSHSYEFGHTLVCAT